MCLSDCATVRDKLAFTVNCRRCKASVHDTGTWAHVTLCRIICLLALFQFCCVFPTSSQPIHSSVFNCFPHHVLFSPLYSITLNYPIFLLSLLFLFFISPCIILFFLPISCSSFLVYCFNDSSVYAYIFIYLHLFFNFFSCLIVVLVAVSVQRQGHSTRSA